MNNMDPKAIADLNRLHTHLGKLFDSIDRVGKIFELVEFADGRSDQTWGILDRVILSRRSGRRFIDPESETELWERKAMYHVWMGAARDAFCIELDRLVGFFDNLSLRRSTPGHEKIDWAKVRLARSRFHHAFPHAVAVRNKIGHLEEMDESPNKLKQHVSRKSAPLKIGDHSFTNDQSKVIITGMMAGDIYAFSDREHGLVSVEISIRSVERLRRIGDDLALVFKDADGLKLPARAYLFRRGFPYDDVMGS